MYIALVSGSSNLKVGETSLPASSPEPASPDDEPQTEVANSDSSDDEDVQPPADDYDSDSDVPPVDVDTSAGQAESFAAHASCDESSQSATQPERVSI